MIVVHVDGEVLRSPDSSGECRLADAAGVPAEATRRLACDASVVEVSGEAQTAGRRTRVIRAALRGRSSRVTTGAAGLSVCRHHHTLVHEGGYRVELGDVPRFFRPDGRELPHAPLPTPPRPELRLGAEEIAAQRMTLVSRWDGTRVDYAEVVATLV